MTQKNVYKWSAIDRVLNSVMTFGGNIILARLLDPSDFGLLAMVAIFIGVAQNISNCGLADGLIHKQNPTQKDYSTVFVFNVSFGVFFGLLFILTSQLVADFFNSPDLHGIMIAIGICFFFQTLCLTQETRMRKELEFKKMAIVRLSATASSLILGIILVLKGYGYWGLVSTRIFLMFFMFLYYIIASRWIPRLYFSVQSFREMFSYGVHLMVTYVCNQFSRNINMAVLGKYSHVSATGLYSQAQKLEEVPFAITESVFNWPFFSVLSNTIGEDERRRKSFSMHANIVFINAIIAALLLAISGSVFHLLYGAKWDAAVPVFRLLLLFGVVTSVKAFYQTILKVYDRTKLIQNLTFIEIGLQLVMLFLCYDKGLMVIALSQIVPVCVILFVYIHMYMKIFKATFKEFCQQFFVPILVAVVPMLITLCATCSWIDSVNSFLATVICFVIFTILVLAECEYFKPQYYLVLRDYIINRSKK